MFFTLDWKNLNLSDVDYLGCKPCKFCSWLLQLSVVHWLEYFYCQKGQNTISPQLTQLKKKYNKPVTMDKIKNKCIDRYIAQLSKTFISNAGHVILRHAMRDNSGERECSTSHSALITKVNNVCTSYS